MDAPRISKPNVNRPSSSVHRTQPSSSTSSPFHPYARPSTSRASSSQPTPHHTPHHSPPPPHARPHHAEQRQRQTHPTHPPHPQQQPTPHHQRAQPRPVPQLILDTLGPTQAHQFWQIALALHPEREFAKCDVTGDWSPFLEWRERSLEGARRQRAERAAGGGGGSGGGVAGGMGMGMGVGVGAGHGGGMGYVQGGGAVGYVSQMGMGTGMMEMGIWQGGVPAMSPGAGQGVAQSMQDFQIAGMVGYDAQGMSMTLQHQTPQYYEPQSGSYEYENYADQQSAFMPVAGPSRLPDVYTAPQCTQQQASDVAQQFYVPQSYGNGDYSEQQSTTMPVAGPSRLPDVYAVSHHTQQQGADATQQHHSPQSYGDGNYLGQQSTTMAVSGPSRLPDVQPIPHHTQQQASDATQQHNSPQSYGDGNYSGQQNASMPVTGPSRLPDVHSTSHHTQQHVSDVPQQFYVPGNGGFLRHIIPTSTPRPSNPASVRNISQQVRKTQQTKERAGQQQQLRRQLQQRQLQGLQQRQQQPVASGSNNHTNPSHVRSGSTGSDSLHRPELHAARESVQPQQRSSAPSAQPQQHSTSSATSPAVSYTKPPPDLFTLPYSTYCIPCLGPHNPSHETSPTVRPSTSTSTPDPQLIGGIEYLRQNDDSAFWSIFEDSLNPGSFDEDPMWMEFPEIVLRMWEKPEHKRRGLAMDFWRECTVGLKEVGVQSGSGERGRARKMRKVKFAEMLLRVFKSGATGVEVIDLT